MRRWIGAAVGLCALTGAATADDLREWHEVAGHEVALVAGDDGTQRLEVDGKVVLEDGLVLLDQPSRVVAGVEVMTGVAGSGGNACNAAPFVLVLDKGAAPRLDGPVDSCADLELSKGSDSLIFAAAPLPGIAGEMWIWTPAGGFTATPPAEFRPGLDAGWAELPDMAGKHPIEVVEIGFVYAALKEGLGAAWDAYIERLGGLGSGDLVPGGYRGEACLKFTCESDFAVLWLDEAGQGVYAYWRVDGKGWVWPAETKTWPTWVAADLDAVLRR